MTMPAPWRRRRWNSRRFYGGGTSKAGSRLDFRPLDISVGHHVPCHIKALRGPIAGPDLLRLIPGLRVQCLDVGCSGMAGTYGFKSDNYHLSQLAGAAMLTEVAPAAPSVRIGRVQQLPNANGRRGPEKEPAPDPVSGAGLWAPPQSGESFTRTLARFGVAMKVLLFARARDLLGADHLVVEHPEPATIGESAPTADA